MRGVRTIVSERLFCGENHMDLEFEVLQVPAVE